MKFERAREILASPETIEVHYQGIPVWIESLNSGTRSANVKADAWGGKVKTVPVEELVEL